MWIRLEEDEINQIVAVLPVGELSSNLLAPPHPDASAFIQAVETDDALEVDGDAVISRGDEGAFVMAWTWVSNEQAGINLDPEDDEEKVDAFGI